MTDTSPDPATQPVVATEPAPVAPVAAPPAENRPSRLMQVLAWVGIVSGIVFITAVVFGTGFFLGAHSGGDGHHRGVHDRGGMLMFHRGGPPMGPGHGMMPPFGPGGPGAFGPGGPGWGPAGPDGPGSRPERPETPSAPAPPARP